MTSEELILRLEDEGYFVTSRALTDWRTKGLLPPLKSRSRGRGKGVTRIWTDADRVLEQAIAICIFRTWSQRADFIRLTLWLTGFEVDLEKARNKWLQRFDSATKSLQKKTAEFSDIEDYLGPVALKTARSITTSSPTLNKQVLGAAIATFMRAVYDPHHRPDRDDIREFTEVLQEMGKGKNEMTGLAVEWGESFIETLRRSLSSFAIRRLVANSSAKELRSAHATWIRITQVFAGLAKERISPQDLLDSATTLRFVASFALIVIPAILLASRLGFKHRIDQSIETISTHISAPENAIDLVHKIWEGFDPLAVPTQLRTMET